MGRDRVRTLCGSARSSSDSTLTSWILALAMIDMHNAGWLALALPMMVWLMLEGPSRGRAWGFFSWSRLVCAGDLHYRRSPMTSPLFSPPIILAFHHHHLNNSRPTPRKCRWRRYCVSPCLLRYSLHLIVLLAWVNRTRQDGGFISHPSGRETHLGRLADKPIMATHLQVVSCLHDCSHNCCHT
jgi:hypothetical protein